MNRLKTKDVSQLFDMRFDDDSNYEWCQSQPLSPCTSGFNIESNDTYFSNTLLSATQEEKDYLSYLNHEILPHTVNIASENYMGHMTGSVPMFIKQLMNVIIGMNQNVVKVETSNILTSIERQVIGTLHKAFFGLSEGIYSEYLQNPNHCFGVGTSGGTIANITALSYALNALLCEQENFSGVVKQGLVQAHQHYEFNDIVIVGSERMHYSIDKAAKLIGLGKNSVIKIRTDHSGSVDILELQRVLSEVTRAGAKVLAIVGIAGSTETGSVDSLDALATLAKQYGAHFHVDAAWGGPYIFSDIYRSKFSGIEHADSVTVCGHKQFYLPIGVSFCLFRDHKFAQVSENNTAYQCRKDGFDLGRYTIEGSRPAFSLLMHALFKIWGKSGIEAVVDHNLSMARTFAEIVKQRPRFELFEEPSMNIVTYRCVLDECYEKNPSKRAQLEEYINSTIQKFQFLAGDHFVSLTELNHSSSSKQDTPERTTVFRAVFCNHHVNKLSMERTLDQQEALFLKAIDKLSKENSDLQESLAS